MSAKPVNGKDEQKVTRLSLAVYRALLLLYPARFRRAYAAQMAQVFRDSCREAMRRGGAAAVARVWRVTLGDLLVSALAEHLQEEMSMKRSALYRATGMVSLVGVAVWIFGVAGLVVGMALTHMTGGPALFPILMTLPTGWMFFVIGFLGLYTWLAEQRGALVWLPGIVAIATLLTMIVAAMYYTYNSQIGVQQMGSTTVVNVAAASQVNQQLDYYAYAVTNLAYPALGLALVVTALFIWRIPALRGVTRTLLVMGALGLIYYYFTDMGAPSLLRNTGTPGIIGMMAGSLGFYATWLGGWVSLGRCLWNAGALKPQSIAAQP